MKKYFKRALFIFMLSLFLLPACVWAEKQVLKEQFPIAADFKLNDLDGKVVVLGDYLGKNSVLLFFWTTWCPYCRSELKELQKEESELLKDKVVVLAINSGEQKDKVVSFVKKINLTSRVLLDQDGLVSDRYELLGVPTYFLINKKGEVVFSGNHFPKERLGEADVR